jgi:CBS-domain-containing membrane protein
MYEERDRAASPSGACPERVARPTRGSARHQRRRALAAGEPLSEESAASVRAAALAIVRHGVRYLPIVDDGTLVGIVAIQGPAGG